MNKNKIKVVSIFNIFIYLALSMVSLFLIAYISQFTFEIEFLPKEVNDFCLNNVYPIFSFIPEKLSLLFENHSTYLLVLFGLFVMFFAFCLLCFMYSIKSISISKLNDYQFLDEKKRIKKYILSYFIIAVGFIASSVIMAVSEFNLSAKIQLCIGVIELLFTMLYLINYKSITSQYVK